MNRQIVTRNIQTSGENAWARFCAHFPELSNFNMPIIRLNNRIYKTAGYCDIESNIVDISWKLFQNHKNHFELYNVIIPHEIAHQIDFNFHGIPKRYHNKNWAHIMETYGLPANPYHTLEI